LTDAGKESSLGVGRRRKTIEPGSKADQPAKMIPVQVVDLGEDEWKVLLTLKREFTSEEIHQLRGPGARKRRVSRWLFYRVAEQLNARKIIGRFPRFWSTSSHRRAAFVSRDSTHFFIGPCRRSRLKPEAKSAGITFLLTVTAQAVPGFKNVNIMAVAPGTEKRFLLEHKAAIDRHLYSTGIPVAYTNVFWGGRSEIKPSEISPKVYRDWWAERMKS
jgi:hypothetical protein